MASDRETAESLADRISESIFDDVCALGRVVVLDGYRVEDAEVSGVDPDVWPIVLLDKDGGRFEVEVDVSVRDLPPLAESTTDGGGDRG